MSVYEFNPLADSRWDEFIAHHPRASVFHSRQWLQALVRTYAYKPIVLTTSAPDEVLQDAIVFCKVDSWLTGRRLVSVPFSDHCEILSAPESTGQILNSLRRTTQSGIKYAELRPLHPPAFDATATHLQPSASFHFHTISLAPAADVLFRNLHKDCIQRKVRRAEREGLTYQSGFSESLLSDFYHLMLRTRRRHGLPPQPIEWFRNLAASFGPDLTIRLAYQGTTPVASLLSLRFRQTVTFKYGSSDERFNALGGVPFLFWKLIEESKSEGMQQIDLGRSDIDAEGLATFKDRLGATRSEIHYFRCWPQGQQRTSPGWISRFADRIFTFLPDRALMASGKFLYRHMG